MICKNLCTPVQDNEAWITKTIFAPFYKRQNFVSSFDEVCAETFFYIVCERKRNRCFSIHDNKQVSFFEIRTCRYLLLDNIMQNDVLCLFLIVWVIEVLFVLFLYWILNWEKESLQTCYFRNWKVFVFKLKRHTIHCQNSNSYYKTWWFTYFQIKIHKCQLVRFLRNLYVIIKVYD